MDIRYTEYFPEYAKYFGRALILLKYMYVMTNSGKLFADELTEWLIEAGFIQSQCQMSIYYKYAPDGIKKMLLIMLMIVSIGIQMKILEMVCWYFGKDIPCEILGIFTLVHVNKNFSIEG